MTGPLADLVDQAALGLPYESKRVFRRAMMHVPWRMYVGRQVAFNRATAEALTSLTKSVRRLERRVDELAGVVDVAIASHRESAAIAVREQLYDTEGDLRRELSDLRIELTRLRDEAHRP